MDPSLQVGLRNYCIFFTSNHIHYGNLAFFTLQCSSLFLLIYLSICSFIYLFIYFNYVVHSQTHLSRNDPQNLPRKI